MRNALKRLREWAINKLNRQHLCVYKVVYLEPYNIPLYILIMDDYQRAWPDLFPRAGWTPGPKAVGSASFDAGVAHIALKRTGARMGSLAHEAAHITHGIMAYVGIEHDVANDEAECYLMGHIVDFLYEALQHTAPTYHSRQSVTQ